MEKNYSSLQTEASKTIESELDASRAAKYCALKFEEQVTSPQFLLERARETVVLHETLESLIYPNNFSYALQNDQRTYNALILETVLAKIIELAPTILSQNNLTAIKNYYSLFSYWFALENTYNVPEENRRHKVQICLVLVDFIDYLFLDRTKTEFSRKLASYVRAANNNKKVLQKAKIAAIKHDCVNEFWKIYSTKIVKIGEYNIFGMTCQQH